MSGEWECVDGGIARVSPRYVGSEDVALLTVTNNEWGMLKPQIASILLSREDVEVLYRMMLAHTEAKK